MTAIRCLALDVDGTLTDGRLLVNAAAGDEWRVFDVHDGFALRLYQDAGGRVVLCSGKGGGSITHRARVLGIDHVIQTSADKVADLGAVLDQLGLTFAETAFVGDDWPDIPVMRRCGLAIAPANARPEVRAVAHRVTTRPGGAGAVREVVEYLLQQDPARWAQVRARYEVNA